VSRLPGISDRQANWAVRLIYWLSKRKIGFVTPGTRVRAYWPKWLLRSSRLDALLASPCEIPENLKELAQLKAAALVGCPF
jgi:alkylhydroperoxidase family enzyme